MSKKKKKKHHRPNPAKNATPFKPAEQVTYAKKEWTPRKPKLTFMEKVRIQSKKIVMVTASLVVFGLVVTSMSGLMITPSTSSTDGLTDAQKEALAKLQSPSPATTEQPVDLGNGSNVVKVTIPKDGGDPIVEPVDPNTGK